VLDGADGDLARCTQRVDASTFDLIERVAELATKRIDRVIFVLVGPPPAVRPEP
jgi:hypothetical protein